MKRRKHVVSERLVWPDVLRIVAIFLVLVIHSSSLNQSIHDQNFFSLVIFIFAKISVPLFVMLSGALLLRKQETVEVFLAKRLKKVLVPWLGWTVLYTVWRLMANGTVLPSALLAAFVSTLLSFWFLPMIVGLYVLTPLLRKLVAAATESELVFTVILWFVVMSLLPYLNPSDAFPLFTDNSLIRQVWEYLGYFILGAVMARHSLTAIGRWTAGVVLLSSVLVTTLLTYSASFPLVSQGGGIAEHWFDYLAPGVVVATVCTFSLLKTWVESSQHRFSNARKKVIESVSRASLNIYFVHVIAQEGLSRILGEHNLMLSDNVLDLLLRTALLFVVSLGLVAGLRLIWTKIFMRVPTWWISRHW